MNHLPYSSAKLTSNPQGRFWAQIHESSPVGEELEKGKLFVVIGNREESFALDQGKKTFTDFSEEFYSSDETVYQSLVKATKKICNEPFEFIAICIVGQVMYLTSFGGGYCYIFREGQLVSLMRGKSELLNLSGQLKSGDNIIVGTKSFFLDTPLGLIQSSLSAANPTKASEMLSVYTRGEQTHADSAALILSVDMVEPVTQATFVPRPSISSYSVSNPAGSIKTTLLKVVDKLLSILPQTKIRINLSDQDVKSSRRRKVTAIVGLGLLILLGISILGGAKRKEYLAINKAYETKYIGAQKQLEEARSVKDLSRERARTLLLQAKDTVESLKSQGYQNPDLGLLKTSIEDSLGQIAGLYKLDTQLYLDLSLVSSGLTTSAVSVSPERILLLDGAGKKLVSIGIPTKKTEVVAGPADLTVPLLPALYADRDFVLTDRGVEEIVSKPTLVIPKSWEGDGLIAAFAGNIYVLDKKDSQIYRFPASGQSSFGAKQNWLSQDVKVDLTNAQDWVIDGGIWVLEKDGQIVKFSLGRKDYINFSEAGEFSDIFTDEDTKDFYALDKTHSKVVVFDKKGQFKAEYESPVASEATQIAVSQEQKKLFLFAGSKIYFLELKHL